MKVVRISSLAISTTLVAQAAFAGNNIPLPIAGAGGPIGLGVAIIGYGAYRFYKTRQDK